MTTILQISSDGINGFNDVTFTVGNITMMFGLVGGLIAVWVKIQLNAEKAISKIESLEGDVISAKAGRHSLKKELLNKINEEKDHVRARIDKTQAEIKEHKKHADIENKEMREKLNSMDGKLDILIKNQDK